MTTIAEIDRLVRNDDAVAARLWPKLGPKVRAGYLHDRDAWIAVRRDVDAGKQPTAEALEVHRKAFAGWARAFHAVSKPGMRAHRTRPAATTAPAVVVPKSTAPANPEPAPPEAAVVPAVASVKRAGVGAGGAVAGGLVLAGLIAVAARRKRA